MSASFHVITDLWCTLTVCTFWMPFGGNGVGGVYVHLTFFNFGFGLAFSIFYLKISELVSNKMGFFGDPK